MHAMEVANQAASLEPKLRQANIGDGPFRRQMGLGLNFVDYAKFRAVAPLVFVFSFVLGSSASMI